MKNLIQILTTLISFLLFVSCMNDDTINDGVLIKQLKDHEISNYIEIQALNNPIILEGKISSWTNANNIFFSTKTSDQTHLFILQTETRQKLSKQMDIKRLIYLDHMILLETKAGIQYYGVQKEEAKNLFEKLEYEMEDFQTIKYGYGLSYTKLAPQKFENYIRNFAEDSNNDLSSNKRRCDAGGEGASSCSVGDCSVSCQVGYYACCNRGVLGDKCKCIKQDPMH